LAQSEREIRWGSGSLIHQYASGEGNSTGGLESRIDMVAAVTRQGDACSKCVADAVVRANEGFNCVALERRILLMNMSPVHAAVWYMTVANID
jgi:hypothetical protein